MNRIIRRGGINRAADGVALDGIYSLNELNNRKGNAPNAVTNLTATPSNTALSLSWTAPSSELTITNYLVEYVANGVVDSKLTQSNSTSYTLTGLTNGTSYTVRVAAISAVGTGDYSATATGTPASFANPTSLSTLGLWLDGDDPSTMFNATSGGSLASVGQGVLRWEDKSGGGRHARPSFNLNHRLANQQNGRGAVLVNFDYFRTARFHATNNFTIIMVFQATPGDDTLCGVFSSGLTYDIRYSSVNDEQISGLGSPNIVQMAGRYGAWRILTVTHTAGSCIVYHNGSVRATFGSTAGNFSHSESTFGGSSGCSDYYGIMGEIIGYGRVLTAEELSSAHTWLKAKWAIT